MGMGKSHKIKKEAEIEDDDPCKIGTVLFNSGDAKHAEVWDDSDLIDHWDRTVEAYRNQYSKNQHTGDKTVDPPFQQKSRRKTQEGYIVKKRPVLRKKQNIHQNQSTAQLLHTAPQSPLQGDQLPKENQQQQIPKIPSDSMNGQQPPQLPQFMPPMPSLSSNSSQEELSNLMMAWYYCGYYTGLYQGRK